MPKSRRGNKEAKKPRQLHVPTSPLTPAGQLPALAVAPDRGRKR